MFAHHQLAMANYQKKKIGRGMGGTNPMGKKVLLAKASKKNSRGELMQMRNLINRALDHFSKDAIYYDRKIYLETERERDRAWSS